MMVLTVDWSLDLGINEESFKGSVNIFLGGIGVSNDLFDFSDESDQGSLGFAGPEAQFFPSRRFPKLNSLIWSLLAISEAKASVLDLIRSSFLLSSAVK